MANRKITKDVSDFVIAGAVLSNFYLNKLDRMLEWASKTTVVVKGSNNIPINIGEYWYMLDTDITLSTATDMDTGAISNGKDYYVYLCESAGSVVGKISLASTFPTGFTAATSRKIGGFHTLCVNVGTISGHTLTGYLANEILPQSVWDLKHRCRNSKNEGMVYSSETNKWVQIYLASGTGASTASVYGATISDTRNWMDFVDDGGAVGMRLLDDTEFQLIAAGSNEETNITGSADPVTTGGHVDTAARRMISNIGCEDCAGALWQWLRDQSFRYDGGSHTHTFTGSALATHQHDLSVIGGDAGVANAVLDTDKLARTTAGNVTITGADTPAGGGVKGKSAGTPAGSNASTDALPTWTWYDLPGVKGSIYRQGTYGDVKLIAGGYWGVGTYCGSRSRYAYRYRWDAYTSIGGRFLAEPL